jgi:hypothetical protein
MRTAVWSYVHKSWYYVVNNVIAHVNMFISRSRWSVLLERNIKIMRLYIRVLTAGAIDYMHMHTEYYTCAWFQTKANSNSVRSTFNRTNCNLTAQ